MGAEAAARIGSAAGVPEEDTVRAFNEYLYDEQGFAGNRERYDDPRNSFLNEVLDRKTGIPISLAVIYLEVARRAGLRVDGVNFPGHFLLRTGKAAASDHSGEVLIIDPFHGGARLSSVRLPPTPPSARRRRGGVRHDAARPGDAPRNRRPHARRSQAPLRADALVPPGAIRLPRCS